MNLFGTRRPAPVAEPTPAPDVEFERQIAQELGHRLDATHAKMRDAVRIVDAALAGRRITVDVLLDVRNLLTGREQM